MDQMPAEMDAAITAALAGLDLEAVFLERGLTRWVSADADGNVVWRGPDDLAARPEGRSWVAGRSPDDD